MSITKYEKSLSTYEKLIKFSRGLFIKDEKKANKYEDESSMNISSKFLSMLKNRYRLTDSEKTIYANKALLEGYTLLVTDLKIQFKELLGDLKFTYEGTRYVKDWYNKISYNTYMMDRSRYGNIYKRVGNDTSFIYQFVDYTSVNQGDDIYYKRKTGSIFKSVSYDESLNYETVYMLDNDIRLTKIETNPFLNIYDISNNLIDNEYVVKNGINTWEITISELLLERISETEAMYYKQESGVYLPLFNIKEVEESPNLYQKVGASYNPIVKRNLTLEPSIDFYFINKLFLIDPDTAPYYSGSEIFLDNSNNPMTLLQYYINIAIDDFSNIYLKYDDGKIKTNVVLTGVEYLMGFDRETQSFDYTGPTINTNEIDIKILNKSEFCEVCYSKYDEHVDTNNETYYKCSGCGIAKNVDYIFQMRKIFMFTYFSVVDNVRKSKGDFTHLKQSKLTRKNHNHNVALVNFITNTSNANRETNEYYLELYKENVDIVLARSLNDYGIMKYPEGILTNKEFDTFMSIYYKMVRYFEASLYNSTYEVYNNYVNVVHFLIVTATINRFIIDDYKNIDDLDTFSDRDIKNMLYSYGIYSFDSLPRSYKLLILKKITTLFKKRGTESVIDEILEIFNSNNVSVFKYLMVKDFKRNEETGEIIEADVYDRERLLEMKKEYDDRSESVIPTYETILDKRRMTIGDKYDLQDIILLKGRMRSYFINNIKPLLFDDNLTNTDNEILIDEFINYLVNLFKADNTGNNIRNDVENNNIKRIIYKMNDNLKNYFYSLKLDEIRELFVKNEDLFNYNYFKDYLSEMKSIYLIKRIEYYTDKSSFTDVSFYNATDSEKELMISNQPDNSNLIEDTLNHPYYEQMKFLISSIIINKVKLIKDLTLNGMRVALDNVGLQNTPCPKNEDYDLSIPESLNNYEIKLSEIKTMYLDKIVNDISDDRFVTTVNTNYDIWLSLLTTNNKINYNNVYDNVSSSGYINIVKKGNVVNNYEPTNNLHLISNISKPSFTETNLKLNEDSIFIEDNPLIFQ